MMVSEQFMGATGDDSVMVRLHKYRHFLSVEREAALGVFGQMCSLALENNLIGEYEMLFETSKKEIFKSEQYKIRRQQMLTITNPLRQAIQHAESISSFQESVQLYYKIANYYRSVGMHHEAASFYNKLFRLQSTMSKSIYPRSVYFSQWAQELYWDNNWVELSIFLRNELEDPKLADVNLSLLKDLKFIEMQKAGTRFFDNLLSLLTTGDIVKNELISLNDLGLVYSLVLLAYKDREVIKKKTPWSANLQVLFLQNRFGQLLSTIQQVYNEKAKFHPLIHRLYPSLMDRIRQRMLKQYLSAFTSVKLSQVYEETGFAEGEILQLLHRNPQLPYLIDPVTQSIIYWERHIPLYEETVQYALRVREKWRETVKGCINARRNEEVETLGYHHQQMQVTRDMSNQMDDDWSLP